MNDFTKTVISKIHQRKIHKGSNSKIKRIYADLNDPSIDKELEQMHHDLWAPFGLHTSPLFLRSMVKISGIVSHEFVPEAIHYSMIEPVLDNRAFAHAYNDKNFFEKYLCNYADLFPRALLRAQYGIIYDQSYERLTDKSCIALLDRQADGMELILKPSIETGGGDNVVLVTRKKGSYLVLGKVLNSTELSSLIRGFSRGNCVLQHRLQQSPWFSEFNDSSINTLRLYVYRSVQDDVVHPLSGYIRFGNPGSVVDSSSQGGFTMGVDLSGRTNDFFISRFGERFTNERIAKPIFNKHVPNFDEIIKIAKEVAPQFLHDRLLGFDFTVDSDGKTRLLEVNNLYVGIINQQMNSGPLFGRFLTEIIDYCRVQPKSYSIHFYKG